jgi:hypothetical protein
MSVAAYAAARQPSSTTDCHHSKAEFDTLFRQIAQRRDLSPVAKLVHGALVSLHRIGKSRTQVKIGEMVGLTRHQVWTGLHELAASGDILIVRALARAYLSTRRKRPEEC